MTEARRRQEKLKLSPLLESSTEKLRQDFFLMRDARDVSNILEIPYDLLVFHIYKKETKDKYIEIQTPKKNGGIRTIFIPSTGLKIIQSKLNHILQTVYQPKASTQGFTKGKSICTNASLHVKKKNVLNLDLEDFFPSINFGRVRGVFMAKPYELDRDVATLLAQICCHKNLLPQGAPTSPIISNMICSRLDSQLQQLAKRCKSTYTRYADDLTFSTNLSEIPKELGELIRTDSGVLEFQIGSSLVEIISSNGFQINHGKTRLQKRWQRQSVTGLTVNRFKNVDRRYVRFLRAVLHSWEKYGIECAAKTYCENLSKPVNSDFFRLSIAGKINFIGTVKGKDDSIYQKLLSKYKSLSV